MAALLVDSWRADRPDLSSSGSEHAEMDEGCRARARPRLQRHRRRAPARRLRRTQRRPARRPGRRPQASARGKAVTNDPQRARPARRSFPPPSRLAADVLLATDNDRGFTRTVRSQRAVIATAMAARHPAFGPPVDVPGADDRPPDAPPRARRAPGPPRPVARGARSPPALAQRRDRPAGARRVGHEPVAAPADRQYRGFRRRRDSRAQEPARVAALGGRRHRQGR